MINKIKVIINKIIINLLKIKFASKYNIKK